LPLTFNLANKTWPPIPPAGRGVAVELLTTLVVQIPSLSTPMLYRYKIGGWQGGGKMCSLQHIKMHIKLPIRQPYYKICNTHNKQNEKNLFIEAKILQEKFGSKSVSRR